MGCWGEAVGIWVKGVGVSHGCWIMGVGVMLTIVSWAGGTFLYVLSWKMAAVTRDNMQIITRAHTPVGEEHVFTEGQEPPARDVPSLTH